jgi:hypothetical protein
MEHEHFVLKRSGRQTCSAILLAYSPHLPNFGFDYFCKNRPLVGICAIVADERKSGISESLFS